MKDGSFYFAALFGALSTPSLLTLYLKHKDESLEEVWERSTCLTFSTNPFLRIYSGSHTLFSHTFHHGRYQSLCSLSVGHWLGNVTSVISSSLFLDLGLFLLKLIARFL
jgi:hypothetical protein